MEEKTINSAIELDDTVYGKETRAVPKPQKDIGIDVNNTLYQNIIDVGLASKVDIGAIESFTQVSQNRDQLYSLLDTMSEDSLISAILETYAEDATEYNDRGQIVWVESSDSNIAQFVTYLLDTMRIDKNIYKWAYSLCKYGDIYLRIYRESECEDLLFGDDPSKKKRLDEDINVKAYRNDDKMVHYLEMVPNPAEMFELTKFGKTVGYIQAELSANMTTNQNSPQNLSLNTYNFSFRKGDINIYNATNFVHACLEDNSSRTPEEVRIFLDDELKTSGNYQVKRGQSLLYNVFKVWRQLMLLENSVLLNRLTKSSIVRLINVEVGDMPKDQVGACLRNVKQMIEQKSALNESKSLSEYTNPGPVENNVYIPTHGNIGAVTTTQVGGDVDVKGLADLDYFKNRFFGAMRVPKQYFGDTDDAAGFSGGQSLSIISSRYAKMVKRIQNTLIQAITDAINLMLLDKGLSNYINRFKIRMMPPTTQEEIDRRDNMASKVQVASDIMNILSDVQDPAAKLRVLKSLLSNVITDSEVIQILDEQIEAEEARAESQQQKPEQSEVSDILSGEEPLDMNSDLSVGLGDEEFPEMPSSEETISEVDLPSAEDLGIDMTNNEEA